MLLSAVLAFQKIEFPTKIMCYFLVSSTCHMYLNLKVSRRLQRGRKARTSEFLWNNFFHSLYQLEIFIAYIFPCEIISVKVRILQYAARFINYTGQDIIRTKQQCWRKQVISEFIRRVTTKITLFLDMTYCNLNNYIYVSGALAALIIRVGLKCQIIDL